MSHVTVPLNDLYTLIMEISKLTIISLLVSPEIGGIQRAGRLPCNHCKASLRNQEGILPDRGSSIQGPLVSAFNTCFQWLLAVLLLYKLSVLNSRSCC